MVANHQETMRPPNVHNEVLPTHAPHEEEIINIQLPYDPQAPTEPELWSGSFHPISLHGSIKHFALDSKNIKVSLNFLTKYMKNKQVLGDKVDELVNFNSMGDAIWNFISSVYEAKWDTLYTDQKSNILKKKISSKFTLKSNLVIFQTPKHVQDMFDFNMTSNPHGYLVLYVSKAPLVVWYFIIDLISPKVRSYFTLFELKSMVIFICIHCLIISFKLCKFTWNLCGVFPSPNLNSYIVFH